MRMACTGLPPPMATCRSSGPDLLTAEPPHDEDAGHVGMLANVVRASMVRRKLCSPSTQPRSWVKRDGPVFHAI